jgi:hypothetical protein
MKKDTIEYLRNMTDDNLSDIFAAIMDKSMEFTEEEKQIIYDEAPRPLAAGYQN